MPSGDSGCGREGGSVTWPEGCVCNFLIQSCPPPESRVSKTERSTQLKQKPVSRGTQTELSGGRLWAVADSREVVLALGVVGDL